jgi:hypothetical protein
VATTQELGDARSPADACHIRLLAPSGNDPRLPAEEVAQEEGSDSLAGERIGLAVALLSF